MYRSVKKLSGNFVMPPSQALDFFFIWLISLDSLIPLAAFSCSSPGVTSKREPIYILPHPSA